MGVAASARLLHRNGMRALVGGSPGDRMLLWSEILGRGGTLAVGTPALGMVALDCRALRTALGPYGELGAALLRMLLVMRKACGEMASVRRKDCYCLGCPDRPRQVAPGFQNSAKMGNALEGQ